VIFGHIPFSFFSFFFWVTSSPQDFVYKPKSSNWVSFPLSWFTTVTSLALKIPVPKSMMAHYIPEITELIREPSLHYNKVWAHSMVQFHYIVILVKIIKWHFTWPLQHMCFPITCNEHMSHIPLHVTHIYYLRSMKMISISNTLQVLLDL